MKTPYPLMFFVCFFTHAYSQQVLSLPPQTDPIKYELLVHKLSRTFDDDAATSDQRRAYLMLHSAFRSTDDFWHRSDRRNTAFVRSRYGMFAQPYSFKLASNTTFQFRSEVVVYRLNSRNRIALKGLPYQAIGLAYMRKL